MNECFFIGEVIEVGKFKFILNSKIKHKSEIILKVKLFDGNSINAIAYDEKADYILRNDFLTSIVFIQGRLEDRPKEIQINILYIEKMSPRSENKR